MSTADSRPVPATSMMTIAEAAAYLTIPKATLYTWRTRRAGFGPRAVKVGHSLRYRRCDLDLWIAQHLEGVDTAPSREGALNTAAGQGAEPEAGPARRLRIT
jgi:excisionase family DNA binding protein